MNIFDHLQQTTQGIVTKTMGYDAYWQSEESIAEHGPQQQLELYARVLLNKPTQLHEVDDEEYVKQRPRLEYFNADFPGLWEAVEERSPEKVRVNGVTYMAYLGEKKFDGKTIVLFLEPIS